MADENTSRPSPVARAVAESAELLFTVFESIELHPQIGQASFAYALGLSCGLKNHGVSPERFEELLAICRDTYEMARKETY